MRVLKIFAFAVGGLVAALLLVVLAVLLLVNPNDYKDRIIREVKATTGRDLALPGAIKLSVFPWVALQLGPASLGNPPGFQGEGFVSVQHVALRVRLLPLLHRNLEIGRIEVDQLDLNLLKNAAGRGNWEGFGKQDGAAAPAPQAGLPAGSIFQSLAGILITHSRIRYNTMTLADLNLEIGNVAQRASVPVNLKFRLDRGPDASDMSVAAVLRLTLDMPASRYGLQDLDLTGELRSKSGAAALPFAFAAPSLTLDLAAQTLQAPHVTAQFAAARLSGSLHAEKIIDDPVFLGELQLEPVALRDLMTQLAIPLPSTRDPQAYSRFSAKTQFRYADQTVRLPALEAQLDDSRLQGSVAVSDLTTRATDFDLALDHIDIDRYRSPVEAQPAPPSGAKPAPLPASPLKALEVRGTFAIGSAKFSGLTLSGVNLNLRAHAGLLQLAPLKARLYGGQSSADVSYDVRGAMPQLQLSAQLSGVDISPLLKDAVNTQRLSGHGNANLNVTGRGLDSDALMKSLGGHFDLNLADGAIEGADLGYQIGLAQALLKRQSPGAGENTHHTKFDAFKLSANLSKGVATTDDLIIGTPYLRVTGKGTADLVSKALDLKLVTTVLKGPANPSGTDLSELTLAAIPVSVTGTMSEPKVRPDLQGLVKSQLKQKASDLIKNKLNDKLKGLFGR